MKDFIKYMVFLSMLFFSIGCEKYNEQEKYKRPDWLPGKLYTTVYVQDNLSMFAECLRLSGLDSILDISGSWTVFAPDNDAMETYLSDNHYNSISDIPPDELERISEYHVVQNPWSLEQLQSLSAYGWRIGKYKNSDSYAFKRQTIFKNPNEKYWTKRVNKKEVIVLDSMSSDGYKKVFVESRKNVPIFYDEYMDNNGLTSEDFSFYFNRAYEHGNVYYAGAKIIRSDLFAENGFVHIIDKVVDPLPNAKELLERSYPNESYKLFLELIYLYYPTFLPNLTATFNQPEVRIGGLVDTLWDLNYADLAFTLHSERTGYQGPDANQSLVRHNGLFVPTDEAFKTFLDGILTDKSGYPHWPDYRSLPQDIADIIVAQNLKSAPLYPSTGQYHEIFRKKGRFQQKEEAIIREEYGSNCTFIGLNTYVPDRVFTSVTRPVFCRPEYSLFRRAMIYSGAVDAIANHSGELYFFPIHDYALGPDSSLILNWINKDENNYNFREYHRMERRIQGLNANTIRRRILNQVGTSMPNGSANKEFIRTLGGNYITWDHSNNTIRGTAPSTIGYHGYIPVTNSPVPIDEPADNGKVWSVNYWFKFGDNNMITVLSEYKEFYNLLIKAGLIDENSSKLMFSDNEQKYTIFAPSDEALSSYQADTLSALELGKFLKNHFIKGELIFTDNKKPSGNYLTANGESVTIQTGPDIIRIPANKGNTHVVISEKEKNTNLMVSEKSVVSSVVHGIDRVLIDF